MVPTNYRWVQRIIALFNAGAIGFLIDRLTHSPLWGVAIGGLFAIILWRSVSKPPLIGKFLKLDSEASETLRTVLMSLFFFIVCSIAAILTISQ